ncbi:uncharacterized protein YALI1_B06613g [Yarrowia lipolytica]|uniref:Uncharacterized protein n=1 Tax=Yarrowia lipolytica TaxID=4952 RepID=A0A1D8N6I0_YARLL|nr:hypothetical protein YALI1_B06613g [Yarrowia lipolytica]
MATLDRLRGHRSRAHPMSRRIVRNRDKMSRGQKSPVGSNTGAPIACPPPSALRHLASVLRPCHLLILSPDPFPQFPTITLPWFWDFFALFCTFRLSPCALVFASFAFRLVHFFASFAFRLSPRFRPLFRSPLVPIASVNRRRLQWVTPNDRVRRNDSLAPSVCDPTAITDNITHRRHRQPPGLTAH